jgi:hypothetical protein
MKCSRLPTLSLLLFSPPDLSAVCQPVKIACSLVKVMTTNIVVTRIVRRLEGNMGKYAGGEMCRGSTRGTSLLGLTTVSVILRSVVNEL